MNPSMLSVKDKLESLPPIFSFPFQMVLDLRRRKVDQKDPGIFGVL